MINKCKTAWFFLFVFMFGCASQSVPQRDRQNDDRAIITVVLGDLISNVDESGKNVRFVDADEEVIAELVRNFGSSYAVYSVKAAELRPVNEQDSHYFLKDSDREGVTIRANITASKGDTAEVIGSYHGGSDVVRMLYKLKLLHNTWHIVSVHNSMAS